MIREILPYGKGNAVPGNELVRTLGLKDLRTLTQIIELEREVTPICASNDPMRPGYYLPATACELESYIGGFNRRINRMIRTRDNLDEALRDMTGQLTISGW